MYDLTLKIRGELRNWTRPLVMGIINVTPDSFYADSRRDTAGAVRQAVSMLRAGCDIIDLGGYSSRPGAEDVSADEECARLLPP